LNIEKGKYWDKSCNPIVVNECRCEVGDNCWAHQMSKRFDWKSGWYPERLEKISVKGSAQVFAMCWLGDIAWSNTDFEDFVKKTFLGCMQINQARDCKNRPLHTYLFLTKFPERLEAIINNSTTLKGYNKSGVWVGTTVTGKNPSLDIKRVKSLLRFDGFKKWISYEPCYNFTDFPHSGLNQVIIGAESGGYHKTDWDIISKEIQLCKQLNIPCFVKQITVGDKLSRDITEWPLMLRIRDLVWLNKKR